MRGTREARSGRLWLALLPVVLFAALASATANGASSGNVKLFMLPKFTGIPPFTQADEGAKTIGKTYGYTVDYGGPTTSSATQQVQFVDNAVSKGYNGIFISADNPAAVTPALVRARQKGVTVVSYDSDVLPAGRSVYVEGTSADYIAQYQLDMLGSQIGYKGDFVILSAQATDTNQVTWNKLLVADLKKPKYKNMHLLKIINPPDDSTPTAVQFAQSTLKAYPSIKGIIAPTTIAVAAAAQVVQQQKLCSKVVVTGLGDPKQMEGYVKSGCVKQFALWSFTREGQVAACAMHALLSKQITGKQGDKFSCPSGLGSFTVQEGGRVTSGPPVIFTNKNFNLYTF